jgi:hypothetical protein
MAVPLLLVIGLAVQAPALGAADLPPGTVLVAPHIAPPVRSTEVPASGSAAPPRPGELAGDPDQTLCRYVAVTGTRIGRSDCRTRAEWNQLAVDSRQTTLMLQSGQNGFSNSDMARSFTGK